VKEVALKILNQRRMYIAHSVITRFLYVDPDDHIIMELQCIVNCSIFLLDRLILFDQSYL